MIFLNSKDIADVAEVCGDYRMLEGQDRTVWIEVQFHFCAKAVLPNIVSITYQYSNLKKQKCEESVFSQEEDCFMYMTDRKNFYRSSSRRNLFHASMVEHAVRFRQRFMNAGRIVSNSKNYVQMSDSLVSAFCQIHT